MIARLDIREAIRKNSPFLIQRGDKYKTSKRLFRFYYEMSLRSLKEIFNLLKTKKNKLVDTLEMYIFEKSIKFEFGFTLFK